MASTLSSTTASAAASRCIASNQTRFDSSATPPGAVGVRLEALEAALAAAQAETVQMRQRLAALEASTTWRMTRPVRWLVEAVQGPHPAPPAAVPPAPPARPRPLSYAEWIRTEEPARLAALFRAGPGHQPMASPRLGLFLLHGAENPFAAGVAQPAGCTVITVAAGQDLLPAIARCDADLVCFLEPGETLAPGAVALMAHVLAQYPQTDLLFADEDWLDATGRRVQPFFKPGWDEELQRGRDVVGPFAFFRVALLRRATLCVGAAWRHDLANQVAAATLRDRIRHVPAVLCHRSMPAAAPAGSRVVYQLPQPEPLVSIIVPTRDRADLLRVCAAGILNETDYASIELLIVDNGTAEPEALALLDSLAQDMRVRVIRRPGAFNWSALNNAAAAEARGGVLVLLNNDIAVLQPDWLTVLVSHAVQPGVGAVGAKLLYPDGRVQHAGLTTSLSGIPLHLFRNAPGDADDDLGLLGLAREVWAVTGACLAVRHDVFHAVGGLNEALPVAYNDVDFCLRLTAHGYRLVWTPWCRLEHRELASRPPDHAPERREQVREERERLLRDWGALALVDPFLNPNLQLIDEQPCLSSA